MTYYILLYIRAMIQTTIKVDLSILLVSKWETLALNLQQIDLAQCIGLWRAGTLGRFWRCFNYWCQGCRCLDTLPAFSLVLPVSISFQVVGNVTMCFWYCCLAQMKLAFLDCSCDTDYRLCFNIPVELGVWMHLNLVEIGIATRILFNSWIS